MNFVPRFFPIFFLSLLYLYVLFSPFLFCRGRIFSVAFLTVHLTRIFLGAGFQFDFRFVGLFGVFPVENLSTRERARSRGCGTFGARLEFLFFFFFFFSHCTFDVSRRVQSREIWTFREFYKIFRYFKRSIHLERVQRYGADILIFSNIIWTLLFS